MQNLFPGIDPYVEAAGRWRDFHVTFMVAWRDAITEKLPADYAVCLEEQLTVMEYEEETESRRAPDITISKSVRQANGGQEAQVATIERPDLAPDKTRILIEEEIRQAYIKILHLPDQRLVAVLELLSPTNKLGEGRAQYLAKRQQILLSEAHLVELDLLLDGKRLPMETTPAGHFSAVISRAGQRPECEAYSWDLRRAMPSIPIPLRAPDPDIVVDLGDVLQVTYQRGRYSRLINYERPLDLPLSDEYHAWVKEQVAKAAK